MVSSKEITLGGYPRGIHLITDKIAAALGPMPSHALLHLFIRHTSAALTIGENADPDVRIDLENYFDRTVREGESYYRHTDEGRDDMPAHIKSVIAGTSVTIPIIGGKLHLGRWQGIYLCEFRNAGGNRLLTATIIS